MTSQPTLPGIFVTFSELCVWGRTDGHGSRGSCPSAKAPAQSERSGKVQASHSCPPCRALSVPGATTAAEPPGRCGETPLGPSPWHVTHPHPPQEHGLGAGGQSRVQIRPGQGWRRAPHVPHSSGDHGGQRKRRLAPTTCWSERGEGSIFMPHRQSWSSALALQAAWRSLCPIFSPHRLQLWREQPCSFPWPQRAGNAGHEEGWEQGAAPAPCSQAPAGTSEEMCQKIRVTLVPDSPEEVSRENAPTDGFFPHGIFPQSHTNHSHTPGSHLSGYPPIPVSQNSLGCLSQLQYLGVHPTGPGGLECFLGLLAYP